MSPMRAIARSPILRRCLLGVALLFAVLAVRGASQGSWAFKAPMPSARFAHAGATLNGLVHIVGGADGLDCSALTSHDAYDPATDTWTSLAPMTTPRAHGAAAVLNDGVADRLFVVGGSTGCSTQTASLDAYDPATDTWTARAPMPGGARFAMGAAVVDGRLYVAGGFKFNGNTFMPTDAVEAYDPLADAWTTMAPLPQPIYSMAIGAVNGVLYVAGGGNVVGSVADVNAFNPAIGSWSPRAPLSIARVFPASAVVNGRFYALGGESPFLTSVEVYDPASDTWTPGPSLPSPRADMPAAATADGSVYLPGGFDGGSVTGSMLVLAPPDLAPPTTTTTLSPAPNGNGWNNGNVTVMATATDNAGGSGVQSITSTTTGAQNGSSTTPGSFKSITISSEGVSTFTYHATDNAGNVEGDHAVTVRIDRTAPIVANISNQTVTATSSAGAVVTFAVSPSDSGSGVDTIAVTPYASGSTFPIGTTSEQVRVVDRAGNMTTRNFSVTVTPALVSISVSPSNATLNVGQGQSFQAVGHFSDGSTQMLPSSGGGGGGSGGGGGGLTVPAGGTWQFVFPSSLAVSACAPVPGGYSSQIASPDAAGNVSGDWGNPPQVHVAGMITSQQVNLTLSCIPPNGATGTLTASWTGTSYEGTATFSGFTTPVSVRGWSSKAPMPTARFALGAATVNGIVYAIGRDNPGLPSPVEAYDPATDSWSTVSSMPTPREGPGVAALNGKVYVAGGHVSGGVATGMLESYDPAANTWSTLAPMTPRAHLALVAAGGSLYAIGGDTGPSNSGITALVERYDPSTDAWSARAPMLGARSFLVAGALNADARIVVAGASPSGSSTELYDVPTDTWTVGPPMLTSTSGMAAAVVSNALFVFGGVTNGGLTLTHMFRPAGIFQGGPQPDGWSSLASMPTARGELAAAAVGNVVYAIGGHAGTQVLATVESFSAPRPQDLTINTGTGSGGSGSGGGGSLTVQWQSSNPSIAGVSASGFATANAPGQTTIVATANGMSCAASNACGSLTVNSPVIPAHITLTLASGSASIHVGQRDRDRPVERAGGGHVRRADRRAAGNRSSRAVPSAVWGAGRLHGHAGAGRSGHRRRRQRERAAALRSDRHDAAGPDRVRRRDGGGDQRRRRRGRVRGGDGH